MWGNVALRQGLRAFHPQGLSTRPGPVSRRRPNAGGNLGLPAAGAYGRGPVPIRCTKRLSSVRDAGTLPP
ncbi:hypothetical protein AZA_27342 [Nitrospirillum viridazoti Y2]|nr:hypothetical protein AZA_27342 [Nitrospirillum amazonense Y2]